MFRTWSPSIASVPNPLPMRRRKEGTPPADPASGHGERKGMPAGERDLDSPPATDRSEAPARHSPDFRSVHWFGSDYDFTATQAACVSVLWAAWEQGTPDVGEQAILTHKTVDANSTRLIDVFRARKPEKGSHMAWGRMIASGATKGAYRLNPPRNP